MGNLIELSQALDERTYAGYKINDTELNEIDAAMTRYRLFMRWYARNYAVVIDKEWVNATYVFKKRLVDFAATVLLYVTEQEHLALKVDTDHHLTPSTMKKHLTKHITSHWRDLVPYWQLQQGRASSFLSDKFTGMTIVERNAEKQKQIDALGLKLKSQASGDKIYLLSTEASTSSGSTAAKSSAPVASSSTAPLASSSGAPIASSSSRNKRGPPSPVTPTTSNPRRMKRRR